MQLQGHHTAIKIFEAIRGGLPGTPRLHLIGNLMPKQAEYLKSLKEVS